MAKWPYQPTPAAVWRSDQELRKSIAALAQTCERARQQLGTEEKKKWPWRIKSPVVVVGRLIEHLEYIEGELNKLAVR